jgi:uncharacterized protein YjbI with pentapeptide repeats
MRAIKNNEEWKGIISNQSYSDLHFNELIIREAHIKNTEFKNIHFQNCYLGFNSNYYDCTFKKCKFYGKYSSLGSVKGNFTVYDSCNFIDCSFTGMTILEGTKFLNCKFSGLFKNIILRDCEDRTIKAETSSNKSVFSNFFRSLISGVAKDHQFIMGTNFTLCNMEDLIFQNMSIYGKKLFINTKMPKKGLRLYRNSNDDLIRRAKEKCTIINDEYKSKFEVIFWEETHSGQEIIILDDYLIESFFDSSTSRKIFDDLVKGYEIIE